MGICKAVKGANTHHERGTECESEKFKSIIEYVHQRVETADVNHYQTRIHVTVALSEMAKYTSQMV
jgi:hypothetical protein